MPTNGDDIAQEHEIGPSGTTNFGLTGTDRDMDPNLQRLGNREITVTGSHQLTSRVSVTAGWYHRTYQDLQQLDRTLIATADYTSFTIPTPDVSRDATLDGIIPSGPLTVYNLNPAKRSVFNSAQVDKNVDDQSIYNGFDLSFNARLMAGSTLFGSWTTERNVSVFCSTDDNPNGPPIADLYTGVSVDNGGRFCDQRQFDMPFVHEFKLAGSYPVPYVGTRRQRRRAELCGARAHDHVSAGGESVPGRAHEHRNDHPERAWLSVLPSLQSARSEFQEELPDWARRHSARKSTSSTC